MIDKHKFLDSIGEHLTPSVLSDMEGMIAIMEKGSTYINISEDTKIAKAAMDHLHKTISPRSNAELWLDAIAAARKFGVYEIAYTVTVAFLVAQRHGYYRIENDTHRAAVTFMHFHTMRELIKEETEL